MIFRVIIGALVGAVIGYVAGWIVEWFPRFNSTLLDGIHAVTGIGGIRTTALLAAVGFLAGALGGIVHGMARRRRHWQ